MLRIFITLAAFLLVLNAGAQNGKKHTKANYALAAKFSPDKLRKMIFSTDVRPNWINYSDKFWYDYTTSDGKKWFLVDPAQKSKKVLFDNAEMAAKITSVVGDPMDAQHINIQNLRFTDDEKKIRFEVRSTKDTVKSKEEMAKQKSKMDSITKKTFYFEYDYNVKSLKELSDTVKEKSQLSWAVFNPDTSKVFFAKNFNLYWMSKADYDKLVKNDKDSTVKEHQFTKGGEQYNAWGGDEYSTTTGDDKKEDDEKRKRAWLLWSPDGKNFIVSKKDNRSLSPLWVINNVGSKRPTLETYKYQMPGEKDTTETELYIFNAATLTPKQVNIAAFKNQTLSVWGKDFDKTTLTGKIPISYWHGTNDEFYIARSNRDLKKIDVLSVNINGTVKTLVEERSNVYQDIQKPKFVNNGNQFIHWSQRDGWGHFYLYNKNGSLVRQITTGEYNCVEITGYNEASKTLFFRANAKEKNEDPYYEHFYSVNIHGGMPNLLNSGNFNHQISASTSNRYFVDNYSRVNSSPETKLYNSNGDVIMTLEKADLKNLFAAGYKYPEPFTVKAGDGITDLYGVMYKPFDFDSTKKYPIVEYVYPGPQTEAVNQSFGRSMDRIDRLAQMGFIVITVGNRGGHPARSQWYHTYGYGNLRDYGLEDKKVAAEQLANRFSFIDIDKVGITGHSGGGFMSTAAMLVYPDFFKVAVSGAGNHENNIYNRWWSERHHGVVEKVSAKGDTTFNYNIEKNTELAKNLKGKLLLATGDIDNNVHPANTIRMVDALIKANKRFDFLLLPGQRHGFGNMTEYFFWKMADYFSEHLLGSSKYEEVDMIEINKEIPLKR